MDKITKFQYPYLNERGRQVLQLALDGYDNREIAEQMGLTFWSVVGLKKRARAAINKEMKGSNAQ